MLYGAEVRSQFLKWHKQFSWLFGSHDNLPNPCLTIMWGTTVSELYRHVSIIKCVNMCYKNGRFKFYVKYS